MVTKINNPN